MDKTHIKVYFSILGNEFPLEEITKRLSIEPTESFYKGDIIHTDPMLIRKETSWTFGVDYQESYDIMDQINQVLNVLEVKKSELLQVSSDYGVEFLFMIVICVREGLGPAIYLDKRIISFAGSIHAEIHFDVYDFA